jgi:DNA-binding protein
VPQWLPALRGKPINRAIDVPELLVRSISDDAEVVLIFRLAVE